MWGQIRRSEHEPANQPPFRTRVPRNFYTRSIEPVTIKFRQRRLTIRLNGKAIHFFLQKRQSLTPDAPIEPLGRG